MVGPAGGGALVEAISWRAIFWVNIPLIVVCIMLARAYVKESVDPSADRAHRLAGDRCSRRSGWAGRSTR